MISLLILNQRKELNINDKLGKYIKNKHIENLKIIDIMNHESGLKNMWEDSNRKQLEKKYTSATEVYNDNKKDKDLVKDKTEYSNLGYIILGFLIEKISHKKYSEFINENILVPLKMNHTGVENCNITIYTKKGKKLNKYEKRERTFSTSSGSLKSCIKDLLLFANFPLKLLDKNGRENLKKLYIFKDKKDEYMIKHTGGIAGGDSFLRVDYYKDFKVKDVNIQFKTVKN